MRQVYLDNASTSYPKAPGVGEAMSRFITEVGCNMGRGGYQRSYRLAEQVFEIRSALCRMFHFTEESNAIFTPGVTYSLNFVIQGLLKPGDHAIISAMEHNASARPCHQLEAKGVQVTEVRCDRQGRLDMDAFAGAFQENTALVVINHASNVCGTLQDAKKIGALCREKNVPFVLDAAQSAGVVPIDGKEMGISALCLTGHKGLLGPQGIGVLLLDSELAGRLNPLVAGGTGSASNLLSMPDFLPDRLEAGTLNLPGILGLGAALSYIEEKGIQRIAAQEKTLAGQFIESVREMQGVSLVGIPSADGRTGVVSCDFAQRDNAEVACRLDAEYGIMTRCGLHCAPLAHKTLGTYPKGTVRFAFGYKNTEEEVEYTLRALKEILKGGMD